MNCIRSFLGNAGGRYLNLVVKKHSATVLFQRLCTKKTSSYGLKGLSARCPDDASSLSEREITAIKREITEFSQSKSPKKVIQLGPGLVHIKGALSPSEQKRIVQCVLRMGSRPGRGFWNQEKSIKVLNSEPHRGRMYESIEAFPSEFMSLCRRTLGFAAEADSHLKLADPTHLILLYYKALENPPRNGAIPWHQDNGENDGVGDEPVVSFSLGTTCDFLLANGRPRISSKHSFLNPSNLAHRISYESGDAVIFGGPSRLIWHAVGEVYPGTMPVYLKESVHEDMRLNLTFRYTPELCGQEERFATKSAEELSKLPASENPFYNVRKMK